MITRWIVVFPTEKGGLLRLEGGEALAAVLVPVRVVKAQTWGTSRCTYV